MATARNSILFAASLAWAVSLAGTSQADPPRGAPYRYDAYGRPIRWYTPKLDGRIHRTARRLLVPLPFAVESRVPGHLEFFRHVEPSVVHSLPWGPPSYVPPHWHEVDPHSGSYYLDGPPGGVREAGIPQPPEVR